MVFCLLLKYGENIGKNKSKNWSGKYSQKLLDHTKQFATALKTILKRAIQKQAEANGDLFANEIAVNITNVSKTSEQNNSVTVLNENYQEIPIERFITLEERQKITNDLRLI